MGTQVTWNNRIVAAVVGPRTVYPGLGVQRLADAHLKAGDMVTFTFIAADYDTVSGAYPALVIGREGPD